MSTRGGVRRHTSLVLFAAAVIGCSPGHPHEPSLAAGVRVSEAWARPTAPAAQVGAAYFTIESAELDTLVAVLPADGACGETQLHALRRDPEGALGMQELAMLALTAHVPVKLAPGGLHLMLMRLVHPLAAGDTVRILLRFAHAAPQTVLVPVKEPE